MLSDRKLQVERPRLRSKGRGGKEVVIPAYTAMQDQLPLGERMLDTLLRGVSTRNYKDVISQMAETVGVSKSSVSRAAIEAGKGLSACESCESCVAKCIHSVNIADKIQQLKEIASAGRISVPLAMAG